MTLSSESVVKQVEEQVSVDQNGETAILNLQSMTYFGLDEVGLVIWEQMEEPRAVSEICAQVCRHFDVAEDQCRADVLAFLASLDEAGLLTQDATE